MKKIKLLKDFKLRKNFIKIIMFKQLFCSFFKNVKLSVQERQKIKMKYLKLKVSKSQLRNYCLFSGHSHSVYKQLKLSRNIINKMVVSGHVTGCA